MNIENKNTKFNFGDTFYYVGYNSYEGCGDIFAETVETIGFDKNGNVFYNNIPEENCFGSYEDAFEVGCYYLETKII